MLKGIPKKEVIWVRYVRGGVTTHVVTRNNPEDVWHYLYSVVDDKATKVSKSKNPNDFIKIIEKDKGKK